MTRVPRHTASRVLCVTKTMVAPLSRHSVLISRCMPVRVAGSSAENASSISRIGGFMINAVRDRHTLLHSARELMRILARVGFVQSRVTQIAQRFGAKLAHLLAVDAVA